MVYVNISREGLAEFLPDARAVKQFENLQRAVNEATAAIEDGAASGSVATSANVVAQRAEYRVDRLERQSLGVLYWLGGD